MKRLIIILVLGVQLGLPAQPVTTDSLSERQSLLDLSMRQRRTATFLLVGGGIALAAGAIWFSQEFTIFGPASDAETASLLLATAGGGAVVGGLILLGASGRNRRKAETLALDLHLERMELPGPAHPGPFSRTFPAVGIRYNFR